MNKEQESFRDKISTVDESGKRVWIYPKKQTGKLYKYRTILSWFLLAFLFGAPFIRINGQPLLLFNVLERKFVIFGKIFWPQDIYLFVIAIIIFVVFIILFTVVFGRVFCGWVCPQTVFMEMVFRKIEYWIEGDGPQQKKLDAAPWSREKAMKKGAKHVVFFVIAFLIANTFLAYIVGTEQLFGYITHSPAQHMGSFMAVMAFSGLFYLHFTKFREQLCLVVCPYGRLQGVMLDQNSVVVAYDFVRGEPRGKMKKNEERTIGDCIDCSLCVRVCPTGIDIRNGTQLECVNCTACIDACNEIMDKVGLPQDLIRYDSYNGIAEGKKFSWNTRTIAYSAVLVLLIGVLGTLLMTRTDIKTTIFRQPGSPYFEQEGKIINNYSMKFMNKTPDDVKLRVELESPEGTITMLGEDLVVGGEQAEERNFLVSVPKENLDGRKTKVKINVYEGDKLLSTEKTNFLGPLY